MVATISSGRRLVAPSMRATRSAVGGMMGSPSLQPCSMEYSKASSASSAAPISIACYLSCDAIGPFLRLVGRSDCLEQSVQGQFGGFLHRLFTGVFDVFGD